MKDLQEDLNHTFRRARWGLILRGLLAIAFGIFALTRPLQTVAILALVVAFWAIVSGITAIVYALDLRHLAKHWWLVLVGGIISTLFGVVAIFRYPTLSLAFLVLWTAWWLFSLGITEIATSIQERRAGWPWAWHMIVGAIGILAGIFALFNPPATLAALTFWIGFVALFLGVALLVFAGTTKKVQRRVSAAASGTDQAPRAAA